MRITLWAVMGLLAGFFALLAPGALGADSKSSAGKDVEPSLSTRVYDVRDIVMEIPNYPLGGALLPPTQVLQPGGLLAPPAPQLVPGAVEGERNLHLDQLTKVIKDMVSPASWKDNGGEQGAMSTFNYELIISQTAANQSAIESLLEELRKGRSEMVRIRADWLLLAPGQVGQILKHAGTTDALPEVGRDLMDKLAPEAVRYTGEISCFSGQTVNLSSGRAKTTVVSAIPVVATSVSAYQVQTQMVQYGADLQVMPTVAKDSATLDLMSEVSEEGPTSLGATTQPSDIGIDRMNTVAQTFHTTVKVPLGMAVLVGGMTFEPKFSEKGLPQLYLVIEADAVK